MDEAPDGPFEVGIDGAVWHSTDVPSAPYDAIHCAAGAVLAGAEEVTIRNTAPEGSDE